MGFCCVADLRLLLWSPSCASSAARLRLRGALLPPDCGIGELGAVRSTMLLPWLARRRVEGGIFSV